MHDARDRNVGVWIEPSDRLFVAAFSSVASLSVTFSGYFRKTNGDIIEYAAVVNPTSDRVITSLTQHFGAGFLLSCMATLTTGSALRGQCYVRAHIQRNEGTSAVKLYNVLGGYVSNSFSPSFPQERVEESLTGTGMVRSITGTNPAAGVEISETVPTGARWRIQAVRATLVTEATVAARTPTLTIDDGTTIVFRTGALASQAASLTWVYHWASGVVEDTSSATATVGALPAPMLIPAGYRIKTVTAAFQAADDWSAPQLWVEEWIEP